MALGGRCLFRVGRLLERGRLLKEIRSPIETSELIHFALKRSSTEYHKVLQVFSFEIKRDQFRNVYRKFPKIYKVP